MTPAFRVQLRGKTNGGRIPIQDAVWADARATHTKCGSDPHCAVAGDYCLRDSQRLNATKRVAARAVWACTRIIFDLNFVTNPRKHALSDPSSLKVAAMALEATKSPVC